MPTIELSRTGHEVLERTLKRVLADNQEMCKKYPTLKVKIEPEMIEIQQILDTLLRTPRLGVSRDQAQPLKVVPVSERPRANGPLPWPRRQ